MLSELAIILVLVSINGILAMSEIAMVSVRKARLEAAARRGDKRAKIALDLHNILLNFFNGTGLCPFLYNCFYFFFGYLFIAARFNSENLY